ncbi:hypothetical protein [Maribellus sediminis]|uniref:hypothetical protein n=1 Tax=Maribellus sediminis TaxID=2696285 RepID=UPI0014313EBA|nr:hypothetical protein [Maribellus sediminis]
MPSVETITPLVGGGYYHIYNRGANKGNIFFQPENYQYFLALLKKYLLDSVEVLAYCLLPNHFHLLLRIRESLDIMDAKGQLVTSITDEAEIGRLASEKFRRLFISYSQAINRQEKRTGGLFNRNFKRILLEEDDHLKYLFFYIHYNPQKHGFCKNFKTYKFSSFQAYLSNKSSSVYRKIGLDLFDGVDGFVRFHNYFQSERDYLHLES